jgi:hypothetical protein
MGLSFGYIKYLQILDRSINKEWLFSNFKIASCKVNIFFEIISKKRIINPKIKASNSEINYLCT